MSTISTNPNRGTVMLLMMFGMASFKMERLSESLGMRMILKLQKYDILPIFAASKLEMT